MSMEKTSLDLQKIRKDFPILERKINGSPLVYFDNAATTQKPNQVIEAVVDFYKNYNANVHRGIHTLSEEATELYEKSREKVASFVGGLAEELVFTNGATSGLNGVALSLCPKIKSGDEIIVSIAEHHSNFVPWQKICEKQGAQLKVIRVSESGEFPLDDLEKYLSPSTRVVALPQASNVLGTIFPIMRICNMVKNYNESILVVIDGAQSIPHFPVNVKKLGCDFLAFSGHKMLGPMGIGGLWIKKSLLEELDPFAYGGGMISRVTEEQSLWAEPPPKFEAGTPNVAGAIGLAKACEYLQQIGLKNVENHTRQLTTLALEKLREIPDLKILGPMDPKKRTGLISFTVKGAHPHDISAVLNSKGIATRAGQHCAMPLHDSLQIPASTRISFYVYNTLEEVDYFVKSLKEGLKILL